ncbi:16S rRNA (guanine(527)-N(7))-methyltransferase RsmG [Dethiosulfatarculus sandiegensis]|uniref:Ribosomal RNA small subunit methyltransferase G n=1 Tax=Dethiosulfatarculus sandiegensis TaxID=1429043 RepID=A0A0D2JFS3_9BACT|nr:16S rRNA (guanine(527)-N(7))-methyltransferase RsmG [Dethiosulfatarculus sandiegensis]KIX14511.1 16S rRNA methyltransferase [Dethiosulfatarculus sandiegensis]
MQNLTYPELAREAQSICPDLNTPVFSCLELLILELLKWNKVHNLTGHKFYKNAYRDLILDGLCLTKWVLGDSLLDIGSGAGFPGLVLAIALPQLKVTLLEPRAKRVSFQRHVCRLLELENRVTSLAKRSDQIEVPTFYDTITLRAVTSITESMNMAQPFRKKTTTLLLPRSTKDISEAQELGLNFVTYYPYTKLGPRILIVDPRPSGQRFT